MHRVLLIPLLALAVSACVSSPPGGKVGKAGGDTVWVCHKGKKSMQLPAEAVEAHLGHGDTYGPC